MVMQIENKNGVTLVELVILILVVTIIGATMAGVVLHFVQLFIYSPRQLDTQKLAQEITWTMIEGNPDVRGMRFTRSSSIIDASATQFSYTYGYPTAANQLSVRFRWDSDDKHIYRSTSTDGGSTWSAESVIPYYMPSAVSIDGKDTASVIFTYKKAGDADWVSGTDALNTIRRAIISINLATGSGDFADFQASYDFTTSVEVKGF